MSLPQGIPKKAFIDFIESIKDDRGRVQWKKNWKSRPEILRKIQEKEAQKMYRELKRQQVSKEVFAKEPKMNSGRLSCLQYITNNDLKNIFNMNPATLEQIRELTCELLEEFTLENRRKMRGIIRNRVMQNARIDNMYLVDTDVKIDKSYAMKYLNEDHSVVIWRNGPTAKGAYGLVFLNAWYKHPDGNIVKVAAKQISLKGMDTDKKKENIQNLFWETLINKIVHNVVEKMPGAKTPDVYKVGYTSQNTIFMIQEFTYGSPVRKLEEDADRRQALQLIASTLSDLQRKINFMHRDFHGENCLYFVPEESDWIEITSKTTGAKFWADTVTGTTQWEKPEETPLVPTISIIDFGFSCVSMPTRNGSLQDDWGFFYDDLNIENRSNTLGCKNNSHDMVQMLMSCSSEWTLQRSLPWSSPWEEIRESISAAYHEKIRKVDTPLARAIFHEQENNFSRLYMNLSYIKNASEVKQIFFADNPYNEDEENIDNGYLLNQNKEWIRDRIVKFTHPWTIYGLVDVELEDMTAEIVSETLETEQELNILFDVDRILNRAQ